MRYQTAEQSMLMPYGVKCQFNLGAFAVIVDIQLSVELTKPNFTENPMSAYKYMI